jgi:putative amide transporter protein
MLLGVMLLYVGAVLVVNGIWLLGQARLADAGEGGAAAAEAHPFFIQNREVTVLNIFTGFVGVVISVTWMIQGNRDNDLVQVRGSGFILLFAFTYLWVAANNFLNAGGRAFGWFCLFVAVTAIPAGAYTLDAANGNDASVYLGIAWFAWAVLWFVFFLLLALDRPVARLAGVLAIVEGIATAWVFGFLLLEGELAF